MNWSCVVVLIWLGLVVFGVTASNRDGSAAASKQQAPRDAVEVLQDHQALKDYLLKFVGLGLPDLVYPRSPLALLLMSNRVLLFRGWALKSTTSRTIFDDGDNMHSSYTLIHCHFRCNLTVGLTTGSRTTREATPQALVPIFTSSLVGDGRSRRAGPGHTDLQMQST
eukprot:g60861.t1